MKRLHLSRAFLGVLTACGTLSFVSPAAAQNANPFAPPATPAATANKPADADKKPAETKPKADTEGLGQRRDRDVTLGEQFSFREEQVLEEMSELEQRMFRLSEGLKKLEPENSSRLVMGLKYAREELILHQMKETQEALAKLDLKGAADEQKQLVAKLERLQQLLLSTDLDFEMKLALLKQLRETMKQLDAVIKEESREEKLSKQASKIEKELADLAKRKAALEALVKQETAHIETNKPLAGAESLSDEQKADAAKLKEAQDATRQETKDLAAELQDGAAPKNLFDAMEGMESASGSLGKNEPAAAAPAMDKALDALKKELDALSKKEAELNQELTKEKLETMRKDQEANRGATDKVTEMSRELGATGSNAVAELMKASGAMAGAEGAFSKGQAGQGNGEQGKALAALKYAAEQLAEEAERLAKQLRREVKKRVMEGLTAMLEMQVDVRQRTERLAPAVKDGARQALAALTALAKREEKITTIADDLIVVVEETEFGIALPAALAAVRDATESVGAQLTAGDASSDVINDEKQIESDLKAMLEVVGEMSDANSKNGRRGGNGSQEDERKEQNRIISELKMIRLLQTRVKESTTEVDKRREKAAMSAALRKRIEDLGGRQEDIRDATEQLANERAEDLPQQP